MRKRSAAAIVAFGLGCLAWPALAEEPAEPDMDDLDLVKLLNVEVSTATKTAESLDDAPAVITVVTHDDIERWGYRTVAEVLNTPSASTWSTITSCRTPACAA